MFADETHLATRPKKTQFYAFSFEEKKKIPKRVVRIVIQCVNFIEDG